MSDEDELNTTDYDEADPILISNEWFKLTNSNF